jgi:hypothetical protein
MEPLVIRSLTDRLTAFRFWRAAIFLIGTASLGLNTWSIADFMGDRGSQLADYLLETDQILINSMLVAMAVMVFRRNLGLFLIPAIILAGTLVYDRMLLIGGVHSFLDGFEFYHAAFGRHSIRVVSPQYGMIVTYAALLLVLLGFVCVRRTRSFDRMMAVIAAASIMATFTLFHVFLLAEIRMAIESETRVVASVFPPDDETLVAGRCEALKLLCFTVSRSNVDMDRDTGEEIDRNIVRTLDAIATQNVHLEKPWTWSEQTIVHDVTTFWVAAAMTYGSDEILLAVSGPDFDRVTDGLKLQFVSLSVAAHGTWFLILVVLVAIHRKHNRKVVRRAIPPEAFG